MHTPAPSFTERDLAPAGASWASVHDGKWHATVAPKPSWKSDAEATQCGINIRPRNVTWGEMPPTSAHHLCRHCAARVLAQAEAAKRTELLITIAQHGMLYAELFTCDISEVESEARQVAGMPHSWGRAKACQEVERLLQIAQTRPVTKHDI